jgi:predicted nucleic acid-binding protein
MSDKKPSVYLETSFISMLTSRPATHVTTAGMQQFSLLWWEKCRNEFRLFVSDLVYDEITRGDSEAAAKRVKAIENIPVLEVIPDVVRLADEIITKHAFPKKAAEDALHVACAAVHGIDYMMTWNCRHIANETRKPLIERLIQDRGFKPPTLTTPQLLLGDHYDLDLHLRPE